MTPPRPTIDALAAPNGSIVRLAAGGAVFSDLGPAMGRTTAYPHRLLANVPNFRDLVERRMVGNREGYILPLKGVARLLEILEGINSKTDANDATLKGFHVWATDQLIPELKSRFGAMEPSPCKVRICVEGGVDLRLDLSDLSLLRIEIERQGEPMALVQGSALLNN